MDDFIDWYDTWKQIADTPDGDPTFGCRTVNLLILTDGDETCGGAPCTAATQLYDGRNVRTFVVGFGLAAVTGNTLDCIAQNGGTDAIDFDGDGVIDMTGPIYPGNEDELVEALKQIIVAIQPRPRSFAAAAVPQASANTPDKTYLTSFIPLLEEPVWPGRLDAYLRPVPTYEITVDLPDGTTETALRAGQQAFGELWSRLPGSGRGDPVPLVERGGRAACSVANGRPGPLG